MSSGCWLVLACPLRLQILMCHNMQEAKRMSQVILAGSTPLKSCISEEENGMGRALLEVVASKIVQTKEDVSRYVRCTLLSVINPVETVSRLHG